MQNGGISFYLWTSILRDDNSINIRLKLPFVKLRYHFCLAELQI